MTILADVIGDTCASERSRPGTRLTPPNPAYFNWPRVILVLMDSAPSGGTVLRSRRHAAGCSLVHFGRASPRVSTAKGMTNTPIAKATAVYATGLPSAPI